MDEKCVLFDRVHRNDKCHSAVDSTNANICPYHEASYKDIVQTKQDCRSKNQII
jgi:hypothetical protein